MRWDWENLGTFTAWSKSKGSTHKYGTTGTKTVVMEVQDTEGLMDSYSLQVEVVNTAPTASFQVIPGTGDTTTNFSMDASDCGDLEDQAAILEVRWDWEGDGTWDTFWSATKTGNKQYGTVGKKDVTLEVRDSGGMRDTVTVRVEVQ